MFLNCRQKHAFSLSHFLTHKKYISWQVFWRFFRNKIQTCSKTVFSFFNYSQIRPICDKSFTSQNLKKKIYRKTDSNTIYSVGNPFRDKFFLQQNIFTCTLWYRSVQACLFWTVPFQYTDSKSSQNTDTSYQPSKYDCIPSKLSIFQSTSYKKYNQHGVHCKTRHSVDTILSVKEGTDSSLLTITTSPWSTTTRHTCKKKNIVTFKTATPSHSIVMSMGFTWHMESFNPQSRN